MSSWISAHRVRFLAIVTVLLAGTVVASLLDPAPARMVTFVLALGAATAIGGLRTSRSDRRPIAGDERDKAAEQRDRAARERDRTAVHRDHAANHRDEAAEHRDDDADQYERLQAPAGEEADPGTTEHEQELHRATAEGRTRAQHDRTTGWTERAAAEIDRDAALADRGASADERSNAERDRDAALADRGASARDRELASIDVLTGALLRGAGMLELEREHARAERTDQPLALAFIDVDHLKERNDSRGHAAGDRMLREVAETLRASLRAYDVVIRYGGDEFVCALPGMDLVDATARLAIVNTTLAYADEPGSVTIGLAELQPGESVERLIARADAALLHQRRQQRGGAGA